MKWLLTAKEFVKSFYERYDKYVDAVLKFIFALSVFLTIVYHTGYNSVVSLPVFSVILAVIAAFLPFSAISFMGSMLIVVELASVSMEVMGIMLVLLLAMLLSYFVFKVGNSWLMVFTILMCLWNVSPVLLPLGLIVNPADIIVIVFGIIIYGVLIAVKKDFSVLAAKTGSLSLGGRVNLLLTDFLTNGRFLLVLMTVTLAVLLICIIRKSRINYSELISAISGGLLYLIAFLLGNFFLSIPIYYVPLVIGLLIDALASLFLIHFVINMDYKRTENVRFEDEEYVYFVKAIPKRNLTIPEKKVEQITKPKKPLEKTKAFRGFKRNAEEEK